MKALWKKALASGLAVAMTLPLTACGSAGGSGKAKAADANTEKNNVVFEGEDLSMQDVVGEPIAFKIADDRLYFLAAEYAESDDDYAAQEATRVYAMNLDGSDLQKVCEPSLENKEEYMLDLMLDQDKNVFLFSAVHDQEAETAQCFMSKVDGNGNVTEHIDLAEATGKGPDTYISDVYIDDKGDYLVTTDQSVIVLDKNYQKVAEIRNDKGWLGDIAKTPDGKLICGISGEDGACVREIDLDGKKFGAPVKLDLEYFMGTDTLSSGCGAYDFFYNTESGIFGYSCADEKATRIVDYIASGISSENSYGIVPVDAETLIGTTWDSSGARFTRYKKVEAPADGEKIAITYGGLWGVFDEVKDAAIKFNKESDRYKIEFVDYSEYENAEDKMIADILAGDAPDILDLSYVPIEPYVKKGILEDLTPYLEKDDVISKDDLLPSAEKAMEIDGKLYYVSSSFNVKTVLAAKKDVGDKTGWTFDELKALLDEKGEDVRPFFTENKTENFISFLHASVNDFIDWNTGTCSFDSDGFKGMLEVAGRGTNEEPDYFEDDALIKEGKVLCFEGYASTEKLQEYEQMCGSDAVYIGYPCDDRNGSYFSFNNQFGIYAKSKEKEGAWQFVRTFFTKEYQAGDGYMFSNPTNKEAFEMYMKSKTATKAYKDEFGHRITPVKESWETDAGMVKIGPATAEEEKLYRDLIDHTTKVVTFDDPALDIIKEEAANYFNGKESLDDAADVIQNRISTYVNEKL